MALTHQASQAGGEEQGAVQGLRRLQLRFSGEVQGVGFRWTSLRCAEELGLTGWVRNEWDGTVSMELQGTGEQIARFFTAFNDQYRFYPLSYSIDEREDIPVVEGEPSFAVLFG